MKNSISKLVAFVGALTLTSGAQAASGLVENFGCRGAFSNVEFSDLSGDPSGIFVKVDEHGVPKFYSYEGGVFIGHVTVELDTDSFLVLSVTFAEFEGSESLVKLTCEENNLRYEARNWGSGSLKRLSPSQEFELTNGIG